MMNHNIGVDNIKLNLPINLLSKRGLKNVSNPHKTKKKHYKRIGRSIILIIDISIYSKYNETVLQYFSDTLYSVIFITVCMFSYTKRTLQTSKYLAFDATASNSRL